MFASMPACLCLMVLSFSACARAQSSGCTLQITAPGNNSEQSPDSTLLVTGTCPTSLPTSNSHVEVEMVEVDQNHDPIPGQTDPADDDTVSGATVRAGAWSVSLTTLNLSGQSKYYKITAKYYDSPTDYVSTASIFIRVTASGSGGSGS